jgi:hypothetical protein
MDEGLGVFFDQFGNPIDSFFPSPVPGPDFPGGELPNPRDIPGIIIEGEIKNRATEELSKIFDRAGILDVVNPGLVVNLADEVRQGNITANDALNIGFDATVTGGVNTAANIATGGGLAGAQFIFGKIKQAEQFLGRPLLPAEVNQLLGTVLNFPNVVSSGIISLKDRFRSGFADDDDQPSSPGIVINQAQDSKPDVDPESITQTFGGTGGGGGADASRPDFPTGGGNVVIGGGGFTPPSTNVQRETQRISDIMDRRRRGSSQGFNAGGLASIPKYLKGR